MDNNYLGAEYCVPTSCQPAPSMGCTPIASQSFPAPLPTSIPADMVAFNWQGKCPVNSGLQVDCSAPVSVTKALWALESLMCALNPVGIAAAGDCKWVVVKGGKLTPMAPLDALQCLPSGAPGDTILSTGAGWVIGPAPTGSGVAGPAAPETPLTTLDSSSVLLTAGASGNGHTGVRAIVVVDPTAGNTLVSGPKGLYVPAATGAAPPTCATIKAGLETGGCVPAGAIAQNMGFDASGKLVIAPPAAGATLSPLTVTDSSTVDLTTGTGSQNLAGLTAAVKVSAAAGNSISVNADGIFAPLATGGSAPACANVKAALESASCIPAGAIAQNVGFDASGKLVIAPPAAGATLNPLTISGGNGLTLTTGTGGQNLTGVVGSLVLDPSPTNILTNGPSGLKVVAPASATVDCAAIKTALEGNGCISSGVIAEGIGFNASGNLVSQVPTASQVLNPLTTVDSSTISINAGTGGQNLTSVAARVIIDPASDNILVANSGGLYVPPGATIDCTSVLAKIATTVAGGCVRLDEAACSVPNRILGYDTGGIPFAWAPRDLYIFGAAPASTSTTSVFSNTSGVLNDVAGSFWTIDQESGLCGSPSWWDASTGRLTIRRAGLYTFSHTLFVRLLKAALSNTSGTATSNGAIYVGARFTNPGGPVGNRTTLAYANTIRSLEVPLFQPESGTSTIANVTQDFMGTGAFTRLCAVGAQYSLRAVCVTGGNAGGTSTPIQSFIARGDSGNMSVVEQPMSSYSL
jgi:hypothetical protein